MGASGSSVRVDYWAGARAHPSRARPRSSTARTTTSSEDGTQTVPYDGSRATVITDQGALPAVFDGRVVYRAPTDGSTMSFEVLEADGTVTALGPDGEVAEQQAAGYRSVYERVV